MDNIPRHYLLILILISIISIAFGIITVMKVDKIFDGIIMDNNGTVLDVEEYLLTEDGSTNINNLELSDFYKLDSTKLKILPTNISDSNWKYDDTESSTTDFIFSIPSKK